MKNFITFLLSVFISTMLLGEELKPFSMNNDGMSVTYRTTDAKGKILYSSIDSISLDSGDFYNGQATLYSFINSSEETSRVKMPIMFRNGETIVDISTAMSESMAQVMAQEQSSMDKEEQEAVAEFMENIKVTGEPKGIPVDLTVGEELPDYELKIEMGFITTKMKVYERKVTKRENLTTSAGTFDCYVIEETSNVKAMFMSEKEYSRRWYARGIGVVKEEILDKKGRVQQSKILVGLSFGEQ